MHGSVHGAVVRAESGKPIEGAAVVGTRSGSFEHRAELRNVQAPPQYVTAVTDGAGRFGFDDLLEGFWVVRTQGKRGETLGEVAVSVFDDALSEVTITVPEGALPVSGGRTTVRPTKKKDGGPRGSVRGRVVRVDGGQPVEDATITVVRGAGPAPDIAPLTDIAGRFAFDGLPEGEWVLRALGPTGESGEASVAVSADGVSDMVIEVTASTMALKGFRLDHKSLYMVHTIGTAHTLIIQGSIQDEKGDARLTVDPNACTLNEFGDPVTCTEAATQQFAVKLDRLRLEDPTKGGRKIYVVSGHDWRDRVITLVIGGKGRPNSVRMVIESKESGSTVRSPLLLMPTNDPGYVTDLAVGRRSSPRPTTKKEDAVSGSVRGRVVRADSGQPVEDATITVVRGAGPAPDIAPLTDTAGRFAFDGLPEGDWVLRALGPAGELGEASVAVSADVVSDMVIRVASMVQ